MGDERVAVLVVPDLMFQPRIEAALRGLGVRAEAVASAPSLDAALSGGPALAVIDLHAAGFDALDAVRRAHAAAVPVLAFGRHTEPATLRAAREAGAQVVVPRSQLVEELPRLIAEAMDGEK
jgi:DNA-binding NarL/FixJ family response regulator